MLLWHTRTTHTRTTHTRTTHQAPPSTHYQAAENDNELKQKAIIFIYCPDAHYGASIIIVVVASNDAAT